MYKDSFFWLTSKKLQSKPLCKHKEWSNISKKSKKKTQKAESLAVTIPNFVSDLYFGLYYYPLDSL